MAQIDPMDPRYMPHLDVNFSTEKIKGPLFLGNVVTEWFAFDSRSMLLVEDFTFIDKRGVIWTATKDSIIDGASIPRFFWRLMGSPFCGRYRRASVIHDVYCKTKSRPHKEVHRMFYEAMLEDEVPKWKAKLMYRAIKMGGPKWQS